MQLFSFVENKFRNGAYLEKGLFLTYFSHFLVTRDKTQKFLQHISHLHEYTYLAHSIDFFALSVSIGATPGDESCSRHFGAIDE